MTEIKKTVWARRSGFETPPDVTNRNPTPMYAVTKTQNTVSPRVFENITEAELAALIKGGVTVNIDTE